MANKKGFIFTATLILVAALAGLADTKRLHVIAGEEETDYYISFWERQELTPPAKDNYDFSGWCDEEGKELDGNTVEFLLEDKTMAAMWKPKIHTVSYFDGEELLCSRGHLFGYSSPVQNLLTNADKHPNENFVGWADADGNIVSELSSTLSENLSLYAKYEGKEYSLLLNMNNGSGAVIETTYKFGEITVLPTPERTGYTFDGWYTSATFAEDSKIASISDDASGTLVLYAKWIPIPSQTKPAPVRSADVTANMTADAPAVNQTQPPAPPQQEYDRVYCGNYSAKLVPGNSQAIVDAPDSCAYFNFLGLLVLADHANQGFANIKTNNTLTAFGTTYTCVERREGINTGYGIQFEDGLWFDEYAAQIGATLCAYTCNDSTGTKVTATFWR